MNADGTLSHVYDKAGEPLTPQAFNDLLEYPAYRFVARTEDHAAGWWISTVWLGVDYGFGVAPRPVIFETMVFGLPAWEGWLDRYATEQEAREGHKAVVARVEAGEVPS